MRKSKFVGILLNVLPGLGSVYYGAPGGMAVLALSMIGVVMAVVVFGWNANAGEVFLPAGYILMFVISQVQIILAPAKSDEAPQKDSAFRDASLATGLSFIPGLGHLYLGYYSMGYVLLAALLGCVYLLGETGVSIFFYAIFFLVAYSVFDLRRLEQGGQERQAVAGYGYIAMGSILILGGVAMLLRRVAIEYFPFHFLWKVRIALIALALIGGGVWLIVMERSRIKKEKDEALFERMNLRRPGTSDSQELAETDEEDAPCSEK